MAWYAQKIHAYSIWIAIIFFRMTWQRTEHNQNNRIYCFLSSIWLGLYKMRVWSKRKSFKINLKMATKRKRTDYSLHTKYKAIQDSVKGVKSRRQIINVIGVPKSTVARWIKGKDKIFGSYQSSKFEPERKHTRTAQHEDLEEAVHTCFINSRPHNLPVSGPFLKTQPASLAQWLAHLLSKRKIRGSIPAVGTSLVIVKKKPSMTQYDPSKGWPCRLTKHHFISFLKTQAQKTYTRIQR